MTITNNRRPAAMIGITLIVCAVVGSWWGYREYMVPGTPLVWKTIGPERVKALMGAGNPVLVYAHAHSQTKPMSRFGNDPLEFSAHDSRHLAEIRQFVHDYKVELLTFEYANNYRENHKSEGNETALALSMLLLAQHGVSLDTSNELPQFVLAIPGRRLVLVIEGFAPANRVMSAIRNKGM